MNTYPAMQISAHIINTYNRLGEGVTNTRLQKILYIIQVRYVVRHNIPAFKDRMDKWRLGPCVLNVYRSYNWQRPKIHNVEQVAYVDPDTFLGFSLQDECPLEIEDQREIAKVLVKTQHMTTNELIDETRKHNIYWKDKDRVENGLTVTYTLAEIKEHYKENPKDVI